MEVKDKVREKYGQAALARPDRRKLLLWIGPKLVRLRRSDHLESLRREPNQPNSGRGRPGFARLRQSDRAGQTESRRNRARSRLRRRHRRAALRQARRADGQSLRSRHDRRNAGARPREPAQSRDSRTSSFSKARSKTFRCPTTRSMSSFPIASSIFPPTRTRCSREAFRVLKPGGRFAVSDVVVRGDVPAEVRRSMELWVGCIAGALRGIRIRRQAREGGIRCDRHRADPRLQHRRRPAVSHRRGHRRGRDRAAGGRQIHERFYPRRETGLEGVLWSGVL